jgi:hypothetical protein
LSESETALTVDGSVILGVEQSLNLHARPVGALPRNLHRYAAGLVLGLLTAAALVLLARRWAGALAYPLAPAMLLPVAVMAAASAAAIRLAWLAPVPVESLPGVERGVMLLTSLALAGLGAGLCVPGTSAAGVFFFWTLVGVEESWAWGWHLRRGRGAPSPEPHAVHPGPVHGGAPRLARGGPSFRAVPDLEAEGHLPPKGVTQQLTRSQAADGAEELSGWLRIAFIAGQRTGNLHVAFCPPFFAPPSSPPPN